MTEWSLQCVLSWISHSGAAPGCKMFPASGSSFVPEVRGQERWCRGKAGDGEGSEEPQATSGEQGRARPLFSQLRGGAAGVTTAQALSQSSASPCWPCYS